MKTFSINTLGCKVNQYESQQIRELLEQLGLIHLETPEEKPDLLIINTCCVTQSASAKSRQYIRKAQKQSSNTAIAVCGCLPAVQTGELDNFGKDIRIIRHRQTLAETLCQMVKKKSNASGSKSLKNGSDSYIKAKNSLKIKYKNKLPNLPKLSEITSFKGHTRAFLKVQDGCDGYCTYCIIPKTRPFVHSKPLEVVLQEAKALVEAGHKEIVITGIFLGSFGQKTVKRKNWPSQKNNKLPKLLEKLAEIPNLLRIRLSSLEPADITPQLLDVLCQYPNIMPHLHLSLQSGSNHILKKMCRQYTADEFKEKIELIKSRLDRPAITADIIVGFPGETNADFQATADLAKQTGFAKMHVFSFSPRKGTAAASLRDSVNNRTIKKRSQILHELDAELSYKFRQRFVGQTATILTETCNGQTAGHSERYFIVYLKKTNQNHQKNQLLKVKLIKNTNNGVIAELI